MKRVGKVVSLVTNLLLYLIAAIVPKKRQIWVFGAWYVHRHQRQFRPIWISSSRTVVEEVRGLGYSAYRSKSLAGMWVQLRASFAFVCQALQDDLFSPCVGQKTIVVNLWHGLPLKKIMYDAFGDRTTTKNSVGRFCDLLSPYEKRRNDYLIATSVETQGTLCGAFRIPRERALITGFPRNDIFLNSPSKISGETWRCICFMLRLGTDTSRSRKNCFTRSRQANERAGLTTCAPANLRVSVQMLPTLFQND